MVVITPAITTPSPIIDTDFLIGIPNNQKATDPVHAPVIGSGIVTMINSAKGP